jgi:hypothetical protein
LLASCGVGNTRPRLVRLPPDGKATTEALFQSPDFRFEASDASTQPVTQSPLAKPEASEASEASNFSIIGKYKISRSQILAHNK